MDREKLIEAIRLSIAGVLDFKTDQRELECLADHLIENGIGDITAEKYRADRAEEALDLAYEEWTCCDVCMFSIDCKTNRTDCKKAEIAKIAKAEARRKIDEFERKCFADAFGKELEELIFNEIKGKNGEE